jgi:Flp pilus assembly pilin Flp
MRQFRAFLANCSGITPIEYAVIASIIALTVVVSVKGA